MPTLHPGMLFEYFSGPTWHDLQDQIQEISSLCAENEFEPAVVDEMRTGTFRQLFLSGR